MGLQLKNPIEGEYYDQVLRFVTQQEAWDIILTSDEFHNLVQSMWDEDTENDWEFTVAQIEEVVEEQWRELGISHFEGLFLRKDGNVEIEFK